MTEKKRHLIASADERTWKFDRPVIFIGEWCRLYNRKHIWQNMDATLAKPYGLGETKKITDNAEAQVLEERLFSVLYNSLNRHHNTQYCDRFWRILLGHWLRRYVAVMLNRVKTIQQCLQTYQISGATFYYNENYTLATQDSNSAIWAFSDDYWNNALNLRILTIIEKINFKINLIDVKSSSGFHLKNIKTTHTDAKKIIKSGFDFINAIAKSIVINKNSFIINSYLPIKDQLKLELAFCQHPKLWDSPNIILKEQPDRELRKKLTESFSFKDENILEKILSMMLFELLPVCYLEGFSTLNNITKQLPWPKNPKLIFTSNNFDTDEVFKLWVATKVKSGSKYIIGQHGSNYGTQRYMHPTIEEITADKFLTWGWTDGLPQHTPAFIFKTAGKKQGNYDSNGGLLLIELSLSHRITTWDCTAEFTTYFEEQKIFVKSISNALRKHLIIRLHASYKYSSWNEVDRWQNFDNSLQIDDGEIAIKNLIKQSRLVIHSYDSSGFLETLSQNIPTLAFWQNDLEHLRESAKPYYKLLIEVGIIHLTPESIAKHINEKWYDIDEWWLQDYVQAARIQFCERYAKTCKYPIRKLKSLLVD